MKGLGLMMRLMNYLLRLMRGNYVVMEDLSYGQYVKRELRARFTSLEQAKAFAKSMMPQFGGRVVVSDGVSLQPLYVYRRK